MKTLSSIKLEFLSDVVDADFVYDAISTFFSPFCRTLKQDEDMRVATEEAISNCFKHAYPNNKGLITVTGRVLQRTDEEIICEIVIKDKGKGIKNVKEAMSPLYTTCKESSGMGFTVMQNFAHEVKVSSLPQKGTEVRLRF